MEETPKRNSIRQEILAKKISENDGKPMGQLMKESGYSANYAKTPSRLKQTLTWKELMEKYLPDKLLQKRHKQLLNKREFIAIGKKGERKVLKTGEMDPDAVAKGLDMAYKLKDRYPRQKMDITSGGKPLPIMGGTSNVHSDVSVPEAPKTD